MQFNSMAHPFVALLKLWNLINWEECKSLKCFSDIGECWGWGSWKTCMAPPAVLLLFLHLLT